MNQCCGTQDVEVGGKRGWRKIQMLPKLANGHAVRTGLNQLTKRCEARLVTEGTKGF